MLREYLGDMKNKRACVFSSGDNFAAFALSAMEARVTSTDISEKRLDIARKRAKEIGQDIRFIQCDSSDLAPVEDGGFDLVCTTPGTYVINLVSPNSSAYDPYLRLLQNGAEIEHDDDGGGYPNSRITRMLAPGTYQVRVTSFRRGQIAAPAPFSLTVTNG